jgi:hypothetical protein
MTPQQAVEELIVTAVSGAWEVGVSLPGWHIGTDPFEAHYRQAMERYYSVLDRPVALLPEILLAVIWEADLQNHRITKYLNAAQRRYRN